MRARAAPLIEEFARNATHVCDVPVDKLFLLGTIRHVSVGRQNEEGGLPADGAAVVVLSKAGVQETLAELLDSKTLPKLLKSWLL